MARPVVATVLPVCDKLAIARDDWERECLYNAAPRQVSNDSRATPSDRDPAQMADRRRGGRRSVLQPTDISNPDYFHKVVDCQWACPAHTPVPEYIRLIAARRFGEAWAINWQSNVFPGILGRTCDRPCEPACRRVRVEEEPVAICRLKRVAADNKGDISRYLPQPPAQKNGKRIALVGAGPASLTVARDLAPLGYECVIFDGDAKGGGMMRTQIPRFRLPESVTDEEVDRIIDMGVETRYGQFVDSLKELLAEGWDAVFVGSGAPRGRELEIPGRQEAAANIHIGIDWLSSVSFGHIDTHRPARHRARRRQHGDGLLPLVAPARRRGGHGRRPLRLRGDEGLALGEGGRDARGHPDPQLPGAGRVHSRQRQADRRSVREGPGRIRRARPAQPRADRRAAYPYPVRRRAGRDRPGEFLSVDRARYRHRIRPLEYAEGRSEDDAIEFAERVLRRRRGVRPEKHHLGRRARP